MQRIALLFVTGCAYGVQAGAMGVTASRGGPSAEGMVAFSGGFGSKDSTAELKLGGTLGAAKPQGDLQGRFLTEFEYMSIQTSPGWQAHVGMGGSFGAYQSPDLTAQGGAGFHWEVSRHDEGSELVIHSIALDAILGVADGNQFGTFFGLALTYRYDRVETGGGDCCWFN